VRFGILLTSVHDASVDPRQQVREHEELVRSAEDLGFDLMVCGQHFLGSELRYYQPVPWLTHLSAVAPTMRAATGIILLSMVNPVDIAEQMATLDVLSDGRAVFGVGLGYSAHEFDAFGVEPGTRVARFEESLRIVRAMWSGDEVDVEGRFHSVRGARPSVLPVQPGGPSQSGHIRDAVEVAIASLPVGELVAGNGIHLHVAGQKVVTDVYAALRHALQKVARGDPLPHKASIEVRKGDKNGVYLPANRSRFELFKGQVAGEGGTAHIRGSIVLRRRKIVE